MSNAAFIVNYALLQVNLPFFISHTHTHVTYLVLLQLWRKHDNIRMFPLFLPAHLISLTTCQISPAEVFPTRFRGFAHGISAACGKAGAIISALAFNVLSEKAGTPVVLWSVFLFLPLPLMFLTDMI